jgi:hypothetical protein
MPQSASRAHGLAQSLQKCFISREHHELDDVAREAEAKGIQRGAFFVGS